MKGLGRVFNVVAVADGVGIPFNGAGAITFVTFLAAGTQVATITQRDSTSVLAETALDCDVYPHKAPGVGGTWTAMAEQDDTLSLATDATNDCMVFTVGANQLAAGYDSVEVSCGGGALVMAIVHDLAVQRKPSNLPTNVIGAEA